jgi:hypothetical protein
MRSRGRGLQGAFRVARQAEIELFAACRRCGHGSLLLIPTLTVLPDNVETSERIVGESFTLVRGVKILNPFRGPKGECDSRKIAGSAALPDRLQLTFTLPAIFAFRPRGSGDGDWTTRQKLGRSGQIERRRLKTGAQPERAAPQGSFAATKE